MLLSEMKFVEYFVLDLSLSIDVLKSFVMEQIFSTTTCKYHVDRDL